MCENPRNMPHNSVSSPPGDRHDQSSMVGRCVSAGLRYVRHRSSRRTGRSLDESRFRHGSAFIVRDGAQIPAQVGQIVYEADGLRTGVDGNVGVTLKDDTRLSLGPSSEVRLERFVYAPADGGFGMVLSSFAGRRRTCRATWRSSLPTPSASKRRRRSSVSEGRRCPIEPFGLRNEGRATGDHRRCLSIAAMVLAAGCGPKRIAQPARPGRTLIVLLPDSESGTTGRARVSNPFGSADLAAPRDATRVTANGPPVPPPR